MHMYLIIFEKINTRRTNQKLINTSPMGTGTGLKGQERNETSLNTPFNSFTFRIILMTCRFKNED